MRRRLPRRAEGTVGSNAASRWGYSDLTTPVRAVAKSGVGAAPVRSGRWDWDGLLGWALSWSAHVSGGLRNDNGRAHGLRRRLPNRFHSEESDSPCPRVTRQDPSVNGDQRVGDPGLEPGDLFLIREHSAWHARTRQDTVEQQIPAREHLFAGGRCNSLVPVCHLGVSEKCPRLICQIGVSARTRVPHEAPTGVA
jgi:hypothetical protein